MTHRRAALAVLVFAACVAAGALRAAGERQTPQTPPAGGQKEPQQPTFRARIDSISVDVLVTDKQGRPVLDLKPEDFEIRESNKPQAIDTFKLITIDEAANVDPATVREIHDFADQEREAARSDVRLFVIFLDDYHVRRNSALRSREQLANFALGLGPRDLVAVMYPLTPLTGLAFTYDHRAVAEMIRNFEGRKYDYTPRSGFERSADYMPPEVIEITRNEVTTTALRGLCTYLRSLRDGRKTVLFFSEGLAASIPAGVGTTGGRRPPSGTSDRQMFVNSMELNDMLQQVYAAASRSNVSIYTLDPRGLAGSEFDIQDNVMYEQDRQTLRESTDSLRSLADQTDGRAIVNRNDPTPELRQMLRDNSAYYLLSYISSVAPRDGKFHEIQVRVKRKDVEVRARKGYWAYTNDDITKMTNAAAPKGGPPAEVEAALAAVEPARGHAVTVWTGVERGPDGKDLVTFVWEATGAGDAPASEAPNSVTLTASSIYGDMLFQGAVPRDPQAAKPSGRATFTAPPGSVRLQVAAENVKGQRVDHDDREVEAPDFTSTGAALSTPVVFRARTASELRQLRAAASPLPAVTRTFSRTERLLVRVRSYGPGGTYPAITITLLNQLGKSMAAFPPPTATADGLYEIEVTLASLAPAQYVLEISTGGDGKAKMLVAFQVTG